MKLKPIEMETTLWNMVGIFAEDLPLGEDVLVAKMVTLLCEIENVVFIDIPGVRIIINYNLGRKML